MKKFEGFLLVSDLDGTLLDTQKRISKDNLEAIRYFTEEGGRFTFITGRVPHGLSPVIAQFTPTLPIGCMNGGGIYDMQKREYLWRAELDEEAQRLADFVLERFPDTGLEICGFDRNRYVTMNAVLKEHFRLEGIPVEQCTYQAFGAPVAKLLIADEAHRIPTVMEALSSYPERDRFSFIRSTAQYYEILPKGASKGDLARRLTALFGVDPQQVLAVGDNENDISMLKAAAVGYAVANATDAIKAAANRLLRADCDHSAIAELIYGL